ncbi:MAG: YciI family protein [Polyangiaceae bacterium]
MRFMVLVPASKESEAGQLPSAELLEKMGAFNGEMVKAGILLAGEGLHPSSKGARVTFKGGKTKVTDGPFTESKELVAGYWILQVKSREEAIAWISRAPFDGDTTIEIRQVFAPEDFAPVDLTGELMAKEAALRAQVAPYVSAATDGEIPDLEAARRAGKRS